jgi:hypothetical protein
MQHTSTELQIAPRPGLRDQLRARLFAHSLDLALAGGAPVEGDAALALRARRLTGLAHRRALASTIEHVLAEPSRHSRQRVHARADQVADSHDELATLAHRLAEPAPVSARGVAQVRLLLTDGTGPLYNRHSDSSLCDRVESAVAQLIAVI